MLAAEELGSQLNLNGIDESEHFFRSPSFAVLLPKDSQLCQRLRLYRVSRRCSLLLFFHFINGGSHRHCHRPDGWSTVKFIIFSLHSRNSGSYFSQLRSYYILRILFSMISKRPQDLERCVSDVQICAHANRIYKCVNSLFLARSRPLNSLKSGSSQVILLN